MAQVPGCREGLTLADLASFLGGPCHVKEKDGERDRWGKRQKQIGAFLISQCREGPEDCTGLQEPGTVSDSNHQQEEMEAPPGSVSASCSDPCQPVGHLLSVAGVPRYTVRVLIPSIRSSQGGHEHPVT